MRWARLTERARSQLLGGFGYLAGFAAERGAIGFGRGGFQALQALGRQLQEHFKQIVRHLGVFQQQLRGHDFIGNGRLAEAESRRLVPATASR